MSIVRRIIEEGPTLQEDLDKEGEENGRRTLIFYFNRGLYKNLVFRISKNYVPKLKIVFISILILQLCLKTSKTTT